MSRRAHVFPGQGSQRRGMGAELFERYPHYTAIADEILGYSVAELCLRNPDQRLKDTRYTQPALFVVNALASYAIAEDEGLPDFFAGHSLGEYNALLAAGCFDLATGVRLVAQRGRLMSEATDGGMLAVVGLDLESLRRHLARLVAANVDVANHNGPHEVVLSGPRGALRALAPRLEAIEGARCVPLDVSAAFHSRYMQPAAQRFAEVLSAVRFAAPRRPVVLDVSARPAEVARLHDHLARQLCEPVRWYEIMEYLRDQGVTTIREVGPGKVLTALWDKASRARSVAAAPPAAPAPSPAPPAPRPAAGPDLRPEQLGSAAFRRDHGVRHAYVAGAMFRGIASVELVVRMGRAGLLSFLGTGGMELPAVADALARISAQLPAGAPWGANLLHTPDEPEREEQLVSLYLARGVRWAEASAFLRITPAVLRFRFAGSRLEGDRPVAANRVIAKVSRVELARLFMAPAPDAIVDAMIADGRLTAEEGEVARRLPVAQDVCMEADSGGHTDAAIATAVLPAMLRLRDELTARHRYPEPLRLGLGGGLGTPEAIAAAFALGADFVVTGSINQCTVEAGTSSVVKDLLASVEVHDVGYAPAGDMFELGARVQVVRGKGTLFAARANKLHRLYQTVESLDDLDAATRRSLERFCFRRSLDEVWADVQRYLEARGRHEALAHALRSPRQKLVRVFTWYFAHSIRVALAGVVEETANFQIHCGPALGSFNAMAQGTPHAGWRERHVDELAELLMDGAARILQRRLLLWTGAPSSAADA